MLRAIPGLLRLSLLAAGLLATAGACDEWRQFRRDAQRSGYSRDRIPTRVTELWDWEDSTAASAGFNVKLAASSRPFNQCAIWNGRIYAVTLENKLPYVVCADAKSGLRLWQQPLNGWGGCRPEVGPAVAPSGIVFAYDRVPLTENQFHIKTQEVPTGRNRTERARQKVPVAVQLSGLHLRLRAFNAVTGAPMAEQPLPAAWPKRQFNPFITRFYLSELGNDQLTQVLLPGRSSHWGLLDSIGLGPALVLGNQIQAASDTDWVVRWNAGSQAEILRFSDFGVNPVPYDLSTPSTLQGFPLVLTGNGTLVADDRAKRFMGLIGSGPRIEVMDTGVDHMSWPGAGATLLWQYPMSWTLGIPSATDVSALLGVGGAGAQGSIGAFDPLTGRPLWFYPGVPLPDATQPLADTRITPVVSQRTLSPDDADGTWLHRMRTGPYNPRSPGQGARIRPDRDDWRFMIRRFESVSGQLQNLGLVVAPERVYGFVGGALVALDSRDGKLLWRRPQRRGTAVIGLIGTRDHLVVLQDNGAKKPPCLLGIRRKDGKLVWSNRLPAPGQLVPAYSLLYVCQDGRLHAYAPAERTYLMAIDSDRAEEYLPEPHLEPEPDPDPEAGEKPGECQAEAEKPAEEKPAAPRPGDPTDDPDAPLVEPAGDGDATLVRLRWGTPLKQLQEILEARHRLVPHAGMVLVLDWLSLDRRSRINATAPGGWSDREIAEFAHTCAELVRTRQPDHFEVASDVNVYLALHPSEVERVRKLVRAARAAVAAVSNHTRVTISYNCEVLGKVYGRTHYFPFGDLPEIKTADRQAAISLAAEVEEVALTTRPQSGFIQPRQMGPSYFLARRQELGNKPVLITRMETRFDETDAASLTQEQFMHRLFRLLYWLDARVVAYPDLRPSGKGSGLDVALQMGPVRRPALAEWKDPLSWKWVQKLTADVPPPR